MAWVMLIAAGLFEVVGTLCVKLSCGMTKRLPSMGVFVAFAISFYLLSKAAQSIHIGTAYAVWTGIGAVGTAAMGMVWFKESRHAIRIACLALVIAGAIGMKLFS